MNLVILKVQEKDQSDKYLNKICEKSFRKFYNFENIIYINKLNDLKNLDLKNITFIVSTHIKLIKKIDIDFGNAELITIFEKDKIGINLDIDFIIIKNFNFLKNKIINSELDYFNILKKLKLKELKKNIINDYDFINEDTIALFKRDHKILDFENITLEISNHCNLNCPLCWGNKKSPEKNNYFMKYEEILGYFKKFRGKKIYLSGNFVEPTLHPDIINICKSYKIFNRNLINIYTNLPKEFNDDFFIELSKISILNLALFGNKEEHKKYRTNKGRDWDEILNLSKKLKNFKISYISNNHNELNISKDIKKCGFDLQPQMKSKIYNLSNIEESEDIICENNNEKNIFINFKGEIYPCEMCSLIDVKTINNYETYYDIFETSKSCKYCSKNYSDFAKENHAISQC